jgi:hypothetical protein
MANKDELKNKLIAVRNALDAAIRSMDSVAESKENYSSGEICVICGKPISKDDKVRRGRHSNCYNLVYAQFVKTGEKTIDQLVEEGVLGEQAKSGRKPNDAKTLAAEMRRRVDEIRRRKKKD